MKLFHHKDRNKDTANQKTPGAPRTAGPERPGREDSADRRSVGIGGVSIEEFMDQLEKDTAPDETLEDSLLSAERIELVTDRDWAGAVLQPEDEVRQQLVLGAQGAVVFRSARYYRGKGHYGIGRYEERRIAPSAAREIYSLLDTWLFVQKPQLWDPSKDQGSWILRAGFPEGHVQMQRGALTGAAVDGMDLSGFIRQRIPIENLFLFDLA